MSSPVVLMGSGNLIRFQRLQAIQRNAQRVFARVQFFRVRRPSSYPRPGVKSLTSARFACLSVEHLAAIHPRV